MWMMKFVIKSVLDFDIVIHDIDIHLVATVMDLHILFLESWIIASQEFCLICSPEACTGKGDHHCVSILSQL